MIGNSHLSQPAPAGRLSLNSFRRFLKLEPFYQLPYLVPRQSANCSIFGLEFGIELDSQPTLIKCLVVHQVAIDMFLDPIFAWPRPFRLVLPRILQIVTKVPTGAKFGVEVSSQHMQGLKIDQILSALDLLRDPS